MHDYRATRRDEQQARQRENDSSRHYSHIGSCVTTTAVPASRRMFHPERGNEEKVDKVKLRRMTRERKTHANPDDDDDDDEKFSVGLIASRYRRICLRIRRELFSFQMKIKTERLIHPHS